MFSTCSSFSFTISSIFSSSKYFSHSVLFVVGVDGVALPPLLQALGLDWKWKYNGLSFQEGSPTTPGDGTVDSMSHKHRQCRVDNLVDLSMTSTKTTWLEYIFKRMRRTYIVPTFLLFERRCVLSIRGEEFEH